MKLFRSGGLATWLGVGSVTIVLAAVALVAISSVGLLRELSEREALAQAKLAAASASEYLDRVRDDVRRTSRILAGLPTLPRLLGEGDLARLQSFVADFCTNSRMDVCSVWHERQLIATTSADFPWARVHEAVAVQGRRVVFSLGEGQPIALGNMASSPSASALEVLVLRLGNSRLIDELREQVGAQVTIVSSAMRLAGDESADLYAEALRERRVVAQRLTEPNVFAAALPLQGGDGDAIGFVVASIDAAGPDAIVRDLARRLRLIAVVIIAVAALCGIIYGRRLAYPIAALRRAAERIGRGDFRAQIPTGGAREIATLGRSMEEMRANLIELTAALDRREAEAQAVLSGIVEGVYAVDMERRIRYANPQMAQMLGQPVTDMVGRFCGDVLQPEPRDGLRPCDSNCPILAARATTSYAQAAEQLRNAEGGSRSVVIVSAAPAHDRQVQVLRDETAMESARRARDSILANISHEFRTPLAAQLASIELLEDGLEQLPASGRRQLIDNLRRGIVRLMRLIDNLLESVRIDSGQLAIRRQPVALPALVAETAALMEPLLAQRRQRLVTELEPGLPVLSADAQRLMQVFINLLANASKFAPEATDIRLGARAGNGCIDAWVEDEGPGIPAADSATVFAQFRRSGQGEPGQPGLGLGLWIVRSIVERHRGSVVFERTEQGRTRFLVTLPVE